MKNQFDFETLEMLNKIEEETKKILASDYEKIIREIEKEKQDLEFLIN
jgi:hypothetical protein